MKILIAYAGKYGTTKKCADFLAEKLENAQVCNLNDETVDISPFDLIIVGGSIYIGKLQKSVKQFMEKNRKELSKKKIAFFMCCGLEQEIKEQFLLNFPDKLLEMSIANECFGGELVLDQLKGIDKILGKAIINSWMDKDMDLPMINYERIEMFAKKMAEV